jgi:hypothetical protein
VLGMSLRAGRAFDAHDRADALPVAMINESLARLHWPNENPVGKRISLVGAQGPWIEIVGVISDARMASADRPASPTLYMPYAQKTYPWLSWMSVMIRTAPDADLGTITPALRAAVWQADRLLPVKEVVRVRDLYGATIATRRFAMWLASGFGAVALLLSAMGLYGLVSYGVAQQRREIGVRIALGATASGIVRTVVMRSARIAAAGVLTGLIAALLATRLMSSMLYGVAPGDAVTFVVTALLVGGAAVASAWVPAMRAARTSPLAALRG